MLDAGPAILSSIMGVYPPAIVTRMKEKGISWFANVTTVGEAREVVAAGADVVVAQGMEAGGHCGSFDAERPELALIGLFALLPAVVDAVGDRVPVVATGGIADARGIAAALLLGASAVQIGTGLLRTPEAGIAPAWADAIGKAHPEDTVPTRAFSGRLGRSIATAYVNAANSPSAPRPAPYPVQRGLSQAMRDEGAKLATSIACRLGRGRPPVLPPLSLLPISYRGCGARPRPSSRRCDAATVWRQTIALWPS